MTTHESVIWRKLNNADNFSFISSKTPDDYRQVTKLAIESHHATLSIHTPPGTVTHRKSVPLRFLYWDSEL